MNIVNKGQKWRGFTLGDRVIARHPRCDLPYIVTTVRGAPGVHMSEGKGSL